MGTREESWKAGKGKVREEREACQINQQWCIRHIRNGFEFLASMSSSGTGDAGERERKGFS